MSKRSLITIVIAIGLQSCGLSVGGNSGDTPQRDTLHAVTVYGPTSYFIYRGEQMGFDFENIKRFAEEEDMELDLKVAPSMTALLDMIRSGVADIAACPVPEIAEYSHGLRHCGIKEATWQVVVQRYSTLKAEDVTHLIGETVYVESDSRYHYRLSNLNEELGGGITIKTFNRDSLAAEDLIDMVAKGGISMTVVDSDVARLNESYYPGLDFNLKISLPQYSSWAVAAGRDSLAIRIDRWEKRREATGMMRDIYRKYFELSRTMPVISGTPAPDIADEALAIKNGVISSYDNSFRRHCAIPGYDWQFLAAIGFCESRFDNSLVSWAGAKGIMQVMPSTAAAMGIDDISDSDRNILAAARLLKKLDDSLAPKVTDKEERMKFVAAAYNCGLGHIYDAMALAGKYGLDTQKWSANVAEAALLKSNPAYFNDPVVRNGYFRGRETVDFVERVMTVHSIFISKTK